MTKQSFTLDPNAQAYTDDQIVGKVNAATANITRADAVESTAIDLSGKDTDSLSEGSSNKYDTGAPPADLDADTERGIVITDPTTGQYKVIAIHRASDGKLEIDYDDVAE